MIAHRGSRLRSFAAPYRMWGSNPARSALAKSENGQGDGELPEFYRRRGRAWAKAPSIRGTCSVSVTTARTSPLCLSISFSIPVS